VLAPLLDSLKIVLVHSGQSPYVALVLASVATVVGVVALVTRSHAAFNAGVALVVGVVIAGVVGTHLGHRKTDAAVVGASPEMQAEMRVIGYREANLVEKFAGVVALPPALLLFAAFRKRRRG